MLRFVRPLRLPVAAGLLLACGNLQAAPPTPAAALKYTPVQSGVDYERVEPSQVEQCTVVELDEGGWSGWLVLDPNGQRLRRFADTNGDNRVDLWCYYRGGVEVYRDVDSDFNAKADQYRWLGTAGTRWGVDENEDGKINRWKQISAEEVSAELVAAIASRDASRFRRLLLSSEELDQLGLSDTQREQIEERLTAATEQFSARAERLRALGEDAQWVHFAASPPGVVAGGGDGPEQDLVVYENAVAMFESGGNPGQLMVGTLIRVNDCWRLIDLPQLVGDEEMVAQSTGFFFTPMIAASSATAMRPGEAMDDDAQQLVNRLEQVDRQLSSADKPDELAKLNAARADVVEQLIQASSNAQERETWIRQLVDTVGAAVQSGGYPDGLKRLEKASQTLVRNQPELASYVEFQILSADYSARLQKPDPDFVKVQEWWLQSLNDFVERHPSTPEAAQAMLQLALSKEFEGAEKEALVWYRKVATDFPNADAGRKAAGAVRRLDSVGRSLNLKGTTLDGKAFELSRLRGRPVVIHYWATWCEPCKQDMRLLRQLQARYQKAGLQLVGINVDGRRRDAEAFVKANPLPWIQLFEEGGLESSRLANELGVQTLPTMLLIDDKGTVVRHNILAPELDEAISKIVK